MSGISAGWGKEDDCVLVRLYLPGQPDLVTQQAKQTNERREFTLSLNDIADLMVGVHLAAMAEAMSFCEYLKIDPNLMFDVVSNAAGASSIFLQAFSSMQGANWRLKALDTSALIRTRLVCPLSPQL